MTGLSRPGRVASGVPVLLLSVVVLAAPEVPAFTWTAAAQKTAADVALGRARAALWEAARALPLVRAETLGAVLASDADLERRVHQWMRGLPAAGPPRYYSDGVCEVDVTLGPDELAGRVEELLEERGGTAGTLTTGLVNAAKRRWKPLHGLGALDVQTLRDGAQPAGWEDVTADGVLLSRRAAEADAYAALLDELSRLRVDERRTLGDYFEQHPEVRPALQRALRRGAELRVVYGGDRVAEARLTIGLRAVLAALQSVHSELADPGDFVAADFRRMVMRAEVDALTATGLGSPAAEELRSPERALREFNAPAWADEVLRARGRYTPPEGATPSLEVRAAAARLMAIDALRARVQGLVLQDDVTVAEFIAYHRAVKPDVVLMLSGAQPSRVPRELSDGSVEVEVARPARRLWELLRQRMRLEEVPVDEATRSVKP